MPKALGEKEAQVRALRERRAKLAADPVAFAELATGRKVEPWQRKILTAAIAAKPIKAPVQASAPIKETTVKNRKPTKTSRTKKPKGPKPQLRGRKQAAANLRKAKASLKASGAKEVRAKTDGGSVKFKKKPGAVADKKPVPAIDVANFMAREVGHKDAPLGGASMAELVATFGIEAHPMRAKIHYVRRNMPGWSVADLGDDGRYHATFDQTKADAAAKN